MTFRIICHITLGSKLRDTETLRSIGAARLFEQALLSKALRSLTFR